MNEQAKQYLKDNEERNYEKYDDIESDYEYIAGTIDWDEIEL